MSVAATSIIVNLIQEYCYWINCRTLSQIHGVSGLAIRSARQIFKMIDKLEIIKVDLLTGWKGGRKNDGPASHCTASASAKYVLYSSLLSSLWPLSV